MIAKNTGGRQDKSPTVLPLLRCINRASKPAFRGGHLFQLSMFVGSAGEHEAAWPLATSRSRAANAAATSASRTARLLTWSLLPPCPAWSPESLVQSPPREERAEGWSMNQDDAPPQLPKMACTRHLDSCSSAFVLRFIDIEVRRRRAAPVGDGDDNGQPVPCWNESLDLEGFDLPLREILLVAKRSKVVRRLNPLHRAAAILLPSWKPSRVRRQQGTLRSFYSEYRDQDSERGGRSLRLTLTTVQQQQPCSGQIWSIWLLSLSIGDCTQLDPPCRLWQGALPTSWSLLTLTHRYQDARPPVSTLANIRASQRRWWRCARH